MMLRESAEASAACGEGALRRWYADANKPDPATGAALASIGSAGAGVRFPTW